MISRKLSILAITLAAASASPGAVVISEVLYNEVGSDTTGEFIEIHNNGTAAVDISNYKIGDEEVNSLAEANPESGGMFQFPAGTSISAGQTMVIAVSATRFSTVYGFNPTFEVGDTDANVPNLTTYAAWDAGGVINMSNSNDQAVLLDDTDQIADAVSWGNTFAFTPGLSASVSDGTSYARLDVTTDTNTAADWATTTAAPAGATWTSFSTPGTVPAAPELPEPAALALFGLAAFVGLRRR
jgi:MYXO-CTERM domain-containing protein